VIDWCRRNMANYKVPRSVEFVDALPLNAAGKVQKTALREQHGLRHDGHARHEPATATERERAWHRWPGWTRSDRRLIELLRGDGRMAFRALADTLGDHRIGGAGAGAPARDFSGTMKVVAVADAEAVGYELLLAVGVEVDGRPALAVAEALATIRRGVLGEPGRGHARYRTADGGA
jgi:hypothetical protein